MDKATNFKPEFLPKLDELLEFVQKNPYSDFYRKRLGTQEIRINGYEDLAKLPFLTKDDYLSVDLKARTLVPEEEIAFYTFSSGTTNANRPTVMGHIFWDNENFERFYVNQDRLEKIGAKRIMALQNTMSPVYRRLVSLNFRYSKILSGDIYNLKLMAKIFVEAGIQGVYTTATILDYLIKELRESGYQFQNMKWILLSGEFCSSLKAEYFKNTFPQATIDFSYGISEINGARWYRCEYLENAEPYVFHMVDDSAVVEILDEDGQLANYGEMGQMVHTDLKRKAFPMIRYRTGDVCSMLKTGCPCGNPYTYHLGGRAKYDVLKFYAGTLNSELFSRAIGLFKEYLSPDFRLHVSEKESGGEIKPQLELSLRLEPRFAEFKNDPYFIEKVREGLSKNIFISAKSTIHDMVANGAFLPLELKFVDEFEDGYKTKRIISELS